MKRKDRMNDMVEQLYKILKDFKPTQCNEIEIHALLVVTAESHQIPYRHYDLKTKRAKTETF